MDFPPVKSPSLEGLSLEELPPRTIDAQDVLARFRQKARSIAPRRERVEGEKLSLGDEVMADTVGYVHGRLIPFSATWGTWRELGASSTLPELDRGIAEAVVGQTMQVQLVLPADFPVASMQGQPARFLIHIRHAREVSMLSLDSPQLVSQLGLGPDVPSTLTAIARELQLEMVSQQRIAAESRILDELVARAHIELSPRYVDEEITRRWETIERPQLIEHQFDEEELREALACWLDDPSTRRECERRLKVSLVLKSIVDAQQLRLEPRRLEELLVGHAAFLGVTAEQVREGLREEAEITKRLVEWGWHLFAVDYVMSKVIARERL